MARNPLISLVKRLYRLRRGPVLRRRRGARWLLDPRNWIDNRMLAGADFEQAQIAWCLEEIAARDLNCMLDIGANIGLYSVLVGLNTKVEEIHAFEPVARNHAQLHANLLLNHLERRVQVHRLALGAEAGRAKIHIDPRSTGVSAIDPAADAKPRDYAHSEEVEIARLDDVLALKGRRILAKIDVEGYTLNTLKGMRGVLAGNDMVLQVELEPPYEEAVRALLTEAGYREIHRINADGYFTNMAEMG